MRVLGPPANLAARDSHSYTSPEGAPRYPDETVRGRLKLVRSIDGGHPMHRILLTALHSSLFLATLLGPIDWAFGQEEKSKSPGGAPPGPEPSAATLQALVEAHNKVRAEEKLPPLKANDKLTLAARDHARDMAEHTHLTHDGSDGSDAGSA
jgi:hypothetical protein